MPVDEAMLGRAECDAQRLGKVDGAEVPRASQSIPPKVRRAVVARNGGRCAVPGCRNAAFVDVHHVDRRADGGGHEPDGLIALCSAHHDAVHRGALVIRGRYSSGFELVHADRSAHGAEEASPSRSAVLAQVQKALVGLGLKLREVQALCDRVAPHAGRGATVEEVLAAALRAAPGPAGYRVREEVAEYAVAA